MDNRIELANSLRQILGAEAVIDDDASLQLYSSDVYSRGHKAALVIAPVDRQLVPVAIKTIADAGYAVYPRGGGMSYTGGFIPEREKSVVVDTSRMTRIVDISGDDMTITVEAGVTWAQIYEALKPRGLRLPFFGTFSGAKATVGGGMSNGALFMGTARYGTAAEIVQGLEIATTEGRTIRTGQAAFRNGKPFMRSFGPDLTGLFIHDAGTLGIKTLITMRMIRTPKAYGYASFVFADAEQTAGAMSAIARSGRTEEVYVFDPEASRRALDTSNLASDIKRLKNVVSAQGGLLKGLKEGAKLVGAGRKFVADDVFSLHLVCAADTQAAIDDDLAACRAMVNEFGGGEIANSMPKTARANPFEPVNGVLGSHGDRWAALNAKVRHSDATELIAATDKILAKHAEAMRANKVSVTRLFISISNHIFSFEPVLRWYDEWLPIHRTAPEPSHLATLTEPATDLAARKLVATIRAEIVELFADSGAASNQIGKTYRYFTSLDPDTAALLLDLKRSLDPQGLMNPGALEFPDAAASSAPSSHMSAL